MNFSQKQVVSNEFLLEPVIQNEFSQKQVNDDN